jgi:hypothetical protein
MESIKPLNQDVDNNIDAIMYEPSNPIPGSVELKMECTTCTARRHLFHPTTSLPKYHQGGNVISAQQSQ